MKSVGTIPIREHGSHASWNAPHSGDLGKGVSMRIIDTRLRVGEAVAAGIKCCLGGGNITCGGSLSRTRRRPTVRYSDRAVLLQGHDKGPAAQSLAWSR